MVNEKRQLRQDKYREMRNAQYLESDEYKNSFGPPEYHGPSRGRARSNFRKRVLGRTGQNIEAAKISKANTQSVSTRLESTNRDISTIERFGATHVNLGYLSGAPTFLPYVAPSGLDGSAITLPAARIIESLAIGLYVQKVSENEYGLVDESFNTLWNTSNIATPNVFSMISALRPVRTNDYTIVKKQKPVNIEWVYKDNATTLRLERYLTLVNDPLMMGLISACYERSTLDQLHTAILLRVHAKLPNLSDTVVNVDMGNTLEFLQIPPIRTKDKQAIIETMAMFGCSQHDGWGIDRNLDLEDVSIESLFNQFKSSFHRTDLNQYLDLTVPMTQSNIAVVAVMTVLNFTDSNANPIHNYGIWRTESPTRYELPYRMERNIFGVLVSTLLRLFDTTLVTELDKLHYQARSTCIQVDGPNHA
ncbi:hypothetical protein ACOME3_000596 [Neoechinorhynchus agilis]